MSTTTEIAPEVITEVGTPVPDPAAIAAKEAADKASEAAKVARLSEKTAAKKAAEARAAEKLARRKLRRQKRKAKGGNWAQRTGRSIKVKIRKAWRKLKSVLAMLVAKARSAARKAKDLARRAWDKAVVLAIKAKDLAIRAAVKSKELIVAGAVKAKGVALNSWTWMKDAAAGAWVFTAPARNWIATPFRLAAGATVGISTWIVFGSAVLLIGIPWVAYLLVSGKRVAVKKSDLRKDQRRSRRARRKVLLLKKENKQTASKARKQVTQMNRITTAMNKAVAESEAELVLTQEELARRDKNGDLGKDEIVVVEPRYTPAQVGVLLSRADDLQKLLDASVKDKNLFSETSGRIFLVQQRLLGSEASVTAISNLQRDQRTEELGAAEEYHKRYTFTAVKRGVKHEEDNFKNLLAQADELLKQTDGIEPPA